MVKEAPSGLGSDLDISALVTLFPAIGSNGGLLKAIPPKIPSSLGALLASVAALDTSKLSAALLTEIICKLSPSRLV